MKKFRQRLIRQVLVLGIAFFGCIGLTSAQGWEKVFTEDPFDTIAGVISTSDGHIIATIQTTSNSNYFFAKMDTLGNTIWVKEYPDGYLQSIMSATNDGGTIITTASALPSGINQEISCSKMDSDGEIEWTKTYPSLSINNDSLYIYNILQTSDNGFVSLGYSRTNNLSSSFLSKIDENGNLLWSQNLNTSGKYITETAQQDFLMLGQNDTTLLLTKTDASGNLLWSKEYPNETRATQIIERPNGNIMVTTRDKIIRLDDQGDIISSAIATWSNPAIDSAYIFRAEPTEDGFITLCFAIFQSSSTSQFILARYDDDGNLIWDHHYNYYNSQDRHHYVATTADGGFIMGGWTNISNSPPSSDPYLIKTDENGIVYGNDFSGTVKWDKNEDCVLDSIEPGLDNWIITATRPGRSFSTLTDENGAYFLTVDTGFFELTATHPIDYWSACQNNFSFDYSNLLNSNTVDYISFLIC